MEVRNEDPVDLVYLAALWSMPQCAHW